MDRVNIAFCPNAPKKEPIQYDVLAVLVRLGLLEWFVFFEGACLRLCLDKISAVLKNDT